MPLDYLSCFTVVLRGIHGKFDICRTEYSIHSKLRIFNTQTNERLTKVKEK